MKKIWFLLVLFGLTACGGAPVTRKDVSRASFGAKPTDTEAMAKIRQYLARVLIDPDSLRLSCTKVTGKAWARDNMFRPPIFGYLVICDVNAKNKLGGYTGAKEHIFLFNGAQFEAMDLSQYGAKRGEDYDIIER